MLKARLAVLHEHHTCLSAKQVTASQIAFRMKFALVFSILACVMLQATSAMPVLDAQERRVAAEIDVGSAFDKRDVLCIAYVADSELDERSDLARRSPNEDAPCW
ncbi:hypothetical protein DAEQUDRAFT_204184 [Daedalea quercina L-15889]|uniref:Uncharacterized protein n=1 Tax=Daedalea quercina L-15889 TaxID=1314783 RepID=A0A165R7H5_9APHY|nr:hypothetical protein DAEQUDRAFT_204184 [Daedalea quercina L-15889]